MNIHSLYQKIFLSVKPNRFEYKTFGGFYDVDDYARAYKSAKDYTDEVFDAIVCGITVAPRTKYTVVSRI